MARGDTKDRLGSEAYWPTRLRQWNLSPLIQGSGKDKKREILDVAKLLGHPVVPSSSLEWHFGKIGPAAAFGLVLAADKAKRVSFDL